MVGMAVLGIVFVGLYSGMVYGFKLIGMARENLRATQILQERFEGIRLYNWDQLNDATFVTPTFQVPFYPNQSNYFFQGTVTVAVPAYSQKYTNDMRLVTIQLTWTNGTTRCSRDVSSIIARYGLQNYVW